MSPQLSVAIKLYQEAYKNLPFPMEAGWIDDFQKRRETYYKRTEELLQVALLENLSC